MGFLSFVIAMKGIGIRRTNTMGGNPAFDTWVVSYHGEKVGRLAFSETMQHVREPPWIIVEPDDYSAEVTGSFPGKEAAASVLVECIKRERKERALVNR